MITSQNTRSLVCRATDQGDGRILDSYGREIVIPSPKEIKSALESVTLVSSIISNIRKIFDEFQRDVQIFEPTEIIRLNKPRQPRIHLVDNDMFTFQTVDTFCRISFSRFERDSFNPKNNTNSSVTKDELFSQLPNLEINLDALDCFVKNPNDRQFDFFRFSIYRIIGITADYINKKENHTTYTSARNSLTTLLNSIFSNKTKKAPIFSYESLAIAKIGKYYFRVFFCDSEVRAELI